MADKALFEIDLNELETHWQDHPRLVMQYSTELADARLDLEEDEAELEAVRARADFTVRKDPQKFGQEKLTEPAIKGIVSKNKAVRDCEARCRKARHKVNMLSGILRTLDHRKRALENLVKLHGQNYFSVPYTDSKSKAEYLKKRSRRRKRQSGD